MIIQRLHEYYNILAKDPDVDIPHMGYEKANTSIALTISLEGELISALDMRAEGRGNKLVPVSVEVPFLKRRTSGIDPYFLSDNAAYLLGIDYPENPDRTKHSKEASTKLHNDILQGIDDNGAKAVLRFLNRWELKDINNSTKLAECMEIINNGGRIVFRLEGEDGYIHERIKIRQAWEAYCSNIQVLEKNQCLVSGNIGAIAKTHPPIKGVYGSQSSGAALISFNDQAFESYGKKQNFNSPISEEVAFSYTTILNYMLKHPKHHIKIGDETVILWAEKSESLYEEILLQLLDTEEEQDNKSSSTYKHSMQSVQAVADILQRVKQGKSIEGSMIGFDPNVKFYILGLSPNNARLSVRFWHTDHFGKLVERVVSHHIDLMIEKLPHAPNEISLRRILDETVPKKARDRKVNPLLAGAIMRSILLGAPYPQMLYTTILNRIKADGDINYIRVAIIKGCLIRNARNEKSHIKERMLTMSLNEENTSIGYNLGRLFACLEKVQQDATPKLNATIKDRYFSSASATPQAVFPVLLRLAQHHIAKSEFGGLRDKEIQEVIGRVDKFPTNLSLEEQGQFVLGYYHQKQDFYKKADKKS